MSVFQFAGHTLDVARSSLRAADREIELRPKSFEVLRYLIENADRLVTKGELIKATWPNVVATDESLAHCVSEVRNAIGDGQQSIIKTVPRRGYRFAAQVSRRTPDGASAPLSAPAAIPRLEPHAGTDLRREPPDRPSIAVLPFQIMSGDAEQEYFADGVVEEIITALSRFSHLLVIARNSSFTDKGRAVDVKQVGRELGVRYVLEGSVRKAAHQVRITGQLVDAANGAHLWADRFDGALEDVFELQDRVAASVVSAIAPKMEHAEIERAKRKPTESLVAHDYFLRGMENLYHNTPATVSEALRLFSRAIELDLSFAAAYAMAAFCYNLRRAQGWMSERVVELAEAERLARKAVQLGKDDAVSLSRASIVLAYVVRDLDAGAHLIDRALVINPNLAIAWYSSGWIKIWIGEPDLALRHFANFKRLSPLDPLMHLAQTGNAYAHLYAGRYDEAMSQAEQALQESPNLTPALRVSAVANALAGRIEQAQNIMARLRQIDPAFRVSNLKDLTPLRRPEDIAKLAEGMRRAGLPRGSARKRRGVYISAFTNCRGDEDFDAKRSRPSIGKPVTGHARKERVLLFGTDQRITSGPAAKRPHSKAEYMTAPERLIDLPHTECLAHAGKRIRLALLWPAKSV
jgi:TolB-like protein